MSLDDAIEALTAYTLERRPTGDFLRAVLAHDLFEAVARADDESLANLRPIVQFIYCRMPSGCHGSYEKVSAWLDAPLPGKDVES